MKRLFSVVALAILLLLSSYSTTAKSSSTGNQAPIAYFTYSPNGPMPGEAITFDASISFDPDGSIVSYRWDFGDGTVVTASGPMITHSYVIDGTYTVELTATDDDGANGYASAVIEVSTVAFFRLVFYGTLIPLANAKVTAYYNYTGSWVQAPPGVCKFEVRYDNMTQPHIANTPAEKYRNPGFTASILRKNSSNIGFDVYPSYWFVFFKFEWGGYVAYWPNDTARVYSYKNGIVETHDYIPGHRAVWDSSAGTYVIKVNNIHGCGVSPTESHPIIVGILCPPPPQQYYLTVRADPSDLGTIPGQGWYNQDTNVGLTAPDHTNVTSNSRWRFNYWDVDGISQGAGANPITVPMNLNHTATAHYTQQYSVVFDQTGLSADATGTVVTINGSAKSLAMLPNSSWVDSGSSMTYSYTSTVNSTIPGKQYGLTGVTGPSSPITVTGPVNVTGNYVILGPVKHTVTFDQNGVGPDFTATIVTVDGTGYPIGTLPVSFLWDEESTHTFLFSSPLVVDESKQYTWYSTTGLTTLQSGNLTVTGSGNVIGSYSTEIKYQVTFDQTGVGSDFSGTVVVIDGVNYGVTGLPVSFWWDEDSNHTFAFASPLMAAENAKRYVWTSTTGLSTSLSGSLTATTSGTITGNYKTQFYLALATQPPGVTSPSGEGWHDAGTNTSISTPAFIDIIPGSSRYRFNGWQTTNMSEIADPTKSPTTVAMDENKTVTATYVAQYMVTFNQAGVDSDFTGTVVTVDGAEYNSTALPAVFYWDNDTTHSFDFKSPLSVTPNAKRYSWASTTGLTSLQSGFINVTAFGSIVGDYRIQYYLTVRTSPPGIVAIPGEGWYNESASVVLSAPSVPNYSFDRWVVNGVPQGSGVNPITVTMDGAYDAQAVYTTITPYELTIIATSGGTTDPSPGAYSYSSGQTVPVTATPNSGYVLDHWEFDGTNVSSSINPFTVTMNMNHTLKAFFSTAPSPPAVFIDPLTTSIPLGQSTQFTSTVNGGTPPYQYQWYMNGALVPGATSSSWWFTPPSSGMYFVYLKVTDANSNVAYSSNAKVIVIAGAVGGYSMSLDKRATLAQVAAYAALLSVFGVALTTVKRKRK